MNNYNQNNQEEEGEYKPTGTEMLNMEFKKIEQTDEDNVIPWRPDTDGEQITGQVESIREEVGQYNQTVYILRDTDDQQRSIYANTILEQAMKTIKVGDIIKIKFEGTRVSQSGYLYKMFTVSKAIPRY